MKCVICKRKEAVMGLVCSQFCEEQLMANGYFGFVEASL